MRRWARSRMSAGPHLGTGARRQSAFLMKTQIVRCGAIKGEIPMYGAAGMIGAGSALAPFLDRRDGRS
jgi:hypothetical protein